MKKIFLICFLAFLLLLPSYIGTTPFASSAEYGNIPGNIFNGGIASEDENFYYWASLKKAEIYKSNKDFSNIQKIYEGKYGAVQINVSDGYIFFTDGSPGFLKRITTEGKRCEILSLSYVENIVISGDRIYYKEVRAKNDKKKIYSCDLNGKNKRFLAKSVSQFCVDGQTIYYTNEDDKNSLWSMDIFGNNKIKLNSENTINPNFDDEYIYYISNENFNIFRMNKKTLLVECINNDKCSSLNLLDNWLYYTTRNYKSSLCRISKEGKEKQVILDLPVNGINIVGDTVFYRLQEKDWDRYKFNLNTGLNTKI